MIADEVAKAQRDGVPVVALETTILSHGMPYPQNVKTALEVEQIVRANGAVPATIAVLDGRLRAGLSAGELERIGKADGMLKLSRADLAYAVSAQRSGATTVAATMICAKIAGIRVFATGGIGGVHRGADRTMDVSADLYELARTDVAVVCAGAKALLDLPRTLEVLETLGVPVVGYGTDEFPAFWSASSGLPVQLRVDSPAQAAALVRTQDALGMGSGTLIAVPVPQDAELPRTEIESAIECAVAQAQEEGIHGKALTPWLLDRILTITGGRSLDANVALIKNNAAVAAQIAAALCRS